MQVVPLLRAAALRPLFDYLAPLDEFAPRVFGPRLAVLRDARALLPFSEAGRAYALASETLGRPELGLCVGESTQLERVPLGFLLRSSHTLGSLLESLARQGSRFNTGQRFWLVHRGEDVWLDRTLAASLTRGRSQVGDLILALTLAVVRRAAGPGWRPAEIRFEGPPPAHADRLAALAWGRVSFGHASTSFGIPRRLLALRLPRRDLSERGVPADVPSTDPLASLEQAVDALLRLGEPEIAAAAEAAGVSVRTLQRQLHDAGATFAGLVQRVRMRAALDLLREPGVKVTEVSAALGYTDSANFTRAFRRWTGLSPQAFRRAARELAPELASA